MTSKTTKHGHLDMKIFVAVVTVVFFGFVACALGMPVKLVPLAAFANGFEYLEGVGVAPTGNVYVVDSGHSRVEEFTAMGGEFVLMFGQGVNKKGGDVCTKAEAGECQAGAQGEAAGELPGASSLTVDPATGDVYVAELVFGKGTGTVGMRVQEFTGEGQFVLEIGKEVNETTKGNLCSEEEVEKAGVKCGGPRQYPFGVHPTPEPGALDLRQGVGDLLAVGGPKGLLYVANYERVQEFDAAGRNVGEIPVACYVGAVAVDEAGDVYALCGEQKAVKEFNPSGVEIVDIAIDPRESGNEVFEATGIALDPSDEFLAVSAYELPGHPGGSRGPYGLLFAAGTGHLITNFTIPGNNSPHGMAFDAGSHLYATMKGEALDEVLIYFPVSVAELVTSPMECSAGPDSETDATVNCKLNGKVDGWGVPSTQAWLEWGRTQLLGEESPPVAIPVLKKEGEEEELVGVSALVEDLRPNITLFFRVAGEDANVLAPELLTSETVSEHTALVPPRIVGEPSASFVTSSSAVLHGELNPENADTTYEFQYGLCKQLSECSGTKTTLAERSPRYGTIATTMEARGLRPATAYRYRLVADNRQVVDKKVEGGEVEGVEGEFTTAAAPVPTVAKGMPSAIGTTTATITGIVNPDGQPATYAFELGIYTGASTRYGTVFSGPVSASLTPIVESLALTGLQPGTSYAYRIKISSGYGTTSSEPATFETQGLQEVLPPVPPASLLPVPIVKFPQEPKTCGKKRGKRHVICKKTTRKHGAKAKKKATRKR